jgi:hypothetical protein
MIHAYIYSNARVENNPSCYFLIKCMGMRGNNRGRGRIFPYFFNDTPLRLTDAMGNLLKNILYTIIVRTIIVFMKNITLSADEDLIARAREQARARQTTLNRLFRQWLAEVAEQKERSSKIRALLDRLDGVDTGGNFNREKINVR